MRNAIYVSLLLLHTAAQIYQSLHLEKLQILFVWTWAQYQDKCLDFHEKIPLIDELEFSSTCQLP